MFVFNLNFDSSSKFDFRITYQFQVRCLFSICISNWIPSLILDWLPNPIPTWFSNCISTRIAVFVFDCTSQQVLFLFLFLVSTSIQLFDVVLSVHTSIPNCAFRLHVKLNSDFDSGFEFKVQLRIWFSTCILNIITMLVFELSSQYNFDSALASNVKFDSDNGFGFSFYSLTPNLVFWLNFKFDSECWCLI